MKAVDKAINAVIAPRLKVLGFARRHHTWNRREAWRIQVVSVQQSSNNTEIEARFTVNLGYRIGIVKADWVRPTECRPETRRLGFLTPAREDTWYRCVPGDPSDVERAVRDCLADIESYGLPWLDGLVGSDRPGPSGDPARRAARPSSLAGWVRRLVRWR